jgi:hypothetical protein
MKFRAGKSTVQAGPALATLSLALVALPGQALAADPCNDATAAQYANETQQCLGASAGSGGGGNEQAAGQGEQAAGQGEQAARVAVATASSGSSLPFTGLDVAVLAVVALALTGTGVVLRRLASIGDSEK